VEPSHTYPRFEYSHFGLSTQLHRFNKTSGVIVFDRSARTGSVDITIDARSVDSGYAVFNEHLQGEEFFDTARYPTITYKSTGVRFEGDKPVVVDGLLTIKGVTKPVSLTVTSFQTMSHPILKKDAIGANAVARIKRSDFKASKLTPHVSDEVTLSIAVEAIKL
jgi:polyisoprenoid-binding protein YceI